ncbi:class I SAM-dependent methyltransferase [Nonomuraea sp. NPDC050394]|uniref:class I SAM-dependent methyltransferase n=1 Tax=Nonomuraea sp. NPDC050394 TaxID=3364363 RepID=UPI003796E51C
MIVFRVIQVLLSPLAVIGSLLWSLSLISQARRTGSSATVLASCHPRWILHHLRQRPDTPCVRMMNVLPMPIRFGLRCATMPTIVAHAATGYVPKPFRYPYRGRPPMIHQAVARTTFHDQALARHLPDVEQLVVLGAGFDTRCYLLPPGSVVRCFEIDTPQTQKVKREALAKAGVQAEHVTFVPANFKDDDWFDTLLEAGFDPGRPAYYVWESVTMYLDRQAVEQTLRRIATPGAVVAFDYFTTVILRSSDPYSAAARWTTDRIKEPFTFGIDQQEVAGFLRSCGLRAREQYFFNQDPVMAGFVTATVDD